MIEDMIKHIKTTFTSKEDLVDQSFRSPFFQDLEQISGAFEIKERKRKVNITRPYKCGIAVYQLAKLRMLEFYYDFPDKYIDRIDFESIQMDTDSMYMALSSKSIDDIIRPELREEYDDGGKAEFLSTSKCHDRTPGLFKSEFQGTRMIALTSKCYYAEDEKMKSKISCKGVSKERKERNELTWNGYLEALSGSLDKAINTGFRISRNGVVTYTQKKSGLSAYYKRVVAPDGTHTEPLY